MTDDIKNEVVSEEQIEPIGNIVVGYCDGCHKINTEENVCTVYHNPKAVCRTGCAFSPVVKKRLFESADKKRVRSGQQKQKKKK